MTINADSTESLDSSDRSHDDLCSTATSGPITWIITGCLMELAAVLIWISENYGPVAAECSAWILYLDIF